MKRKKTPLHYAAKNNNKEILEILISNCADINKKDIKSKTPLHYAAKNSSKEIIKILISHGANINIIDEHLKTAIYYATKRFGKALPIFFSPMAMLHDKNGKTIVL